MSGPRRLDEQLDARLAALPREVPPRADLWPAIEAQIVPHGTSAGRGAGGRSWHYSLWGQLAAACVLVAVTAIVTYQLARPDRSVGLQPRDQLTALDLPVVSTPPATPASFGSAPVLGTDYVEARALLARTFEDRIAALPPATRSKVERNLADIRRASAELARALDEHPAHPLLQDLLVSTYEEELALFSQVNQVTDQPYMRNDL
ncbi:MAG TPA: hypothetical protein VLT59_05345 [Steroidobacteraceae bacterium]|nr:hypothetical protein [Steroidobacteraceae bacterium]